MNPSLKSLVPLLAFAFALPGISSASPQSVVRTNAAMRVEWNAANGALFLMDRSGTASSFGPSSGKVIVKGGVESYANGRVKSPVFSAVNGAFDGFDLNFLKYDETNGFSDFTGYVNDFDGQADSVLYANGNVKPCAVPAGETREVAALRVLCNQNDSWNDSLITPALTINANATLKVGAGDRPAQVLLNNRGTYGRAVIAGAGALDFGSAGAVIACASARSGANGVYPARISARIAGSGPVTFAGLFGVRYASVVVDGDNTYSGGTEIAAISVRCKSDAAFGTGPVRVRGNVACGGQICFAKAGVTISNPLTVSGYGNTCFAGTAESYEPGALWFVQDATVAGPVTIDGFARVGGRKHTSTGSVVGTGTFTGAISGGRLQVLKSEAPVVLAGANTYTDGTEVVSSTLVLRGPCSVGTGLVELDNGVLRFENTAPVTFTNDISGIGTVEIAGTAPVTFACKGLETLPAAFHTLQPGSSVDIPNFAACTVALADGDVDLGGASLTLSGFSGAGRVSNGRLAISGEISPAGADRIGTLTFAAGVLSVAGATFVCEAAPEGADRIVVEEPFDLSPIALRTVNLGGRGYATPVFRTEGLTGEFSSTAFGVKWHEIKYGEMDATLEAFKPGMALFIR